MRARSQTLSLSALWLSAIVAIVASSGVASAQEMSAEVTMRTDSARVQVGQRFTLEIRADVTGSRDSQLRLPELGAFEILARQVSNPVSFRFGFGGRTPLIRSTTVHRLTLVAHQPGTIDISPAEVRLGGRTFRSHSLQLVVEGEAQPGAQNSPQGGQAVVDRPGASPAGAETAGFDREVFLRTVVDEARPYVGQQCTLTVYLYVRQRLRNSPSITQEPTTEDFWVQDLLPPSRSLTADRQVVNGLPFDVYVLRRLALFPLRPGPLTIGPTSVRLATGRAFDIFASGRSAPVDRTGLPLTIEAMALPSRESAPANQRTLPIHVGQLQLSAAVDRAQVATGDALTLTLSARGEGQLGLLHFENPQLPGLRVLTPQVDDEVTTARDVVGGVRTIRWLIVPERPGQYPLPSFRVSRFDPETGRYSLVESQPVNLVAAGNAPATAADASADPEASADETSADDAQFGTVRTHAEFLRTPPPTGGGWLYWGLFALGPLALSLGLATRTLSRRAKKNAAEPGSKRRFRALRTQLSDLRPLTAQGEGGPFYGGVSATLLKALETKTGRTLGSLTHSRLREALEGHGLETSLIERVVEELDGCNFARFSTAGSDPGEMERCLDRVGALVTEVEEADVLESDDE